MTLFDSESRLNHLILKFTLLLLWTKHKPFSLWSVSCSGIFHDVWATRPSSTIKGTHNLQCLWLAQQYENQKWRHNTQVVIISTSWSSHLFLLQIPTIGFLYVAGYIGSVGREYLNIVKKEKKPTDKEIIIDVPLALKLSFQGIGWPLRTIQQLRSGSLLEDDRKITVSPR